MLKIFSCCCPGQNETEDDAYGSNDQSRLISNGSSRSGRKSESSPNYGSTHVLSAQEQDEQAILNRILHRTATNVIDVSAIEAHSVEPVEYVDRNRKYQHFLNQLPWNQAKRSRHPALLTETTHVERLLANPPPTFDDISTVQNFVSECSEALKRLKVQHHQDLVVQFHSGPPSGIV